MPRHHFGLLLTALILLSRQHALAHACPANLGSGAGMGISVSAFRADGVVAIGSSVVTECEHIIFRIGVAYFPTDPVSLAPTAAFEGGQMLLTIHGNTFDVTPPGGVPLIGGDGSPGCNGLAWVVSQPLTYIVTAADVAAGAINALGAYTNGTAHVGESDLPRVVYGTAPSSPVRVALSVSCSITPSTFAAIEGNTASFCINATNGAAPYGFNWTGPAGFSATNQCISITNAGGSNAGVYQAIVTDAFGCTNVCEAVLAVIPSLRIAIADGNLTLSWSREASGFVLQQADDLSGSWSPAEDQGNPQIVVAMRAGRFYRLAN